MNASILPESGQHLGLTPLWQPEGLGGYRLVDPADNFFIGRIRRLEGRFERHRQLVHAIGRAGGGNSLRSGGDVNARQPTRMRDMGIKHNRGDPFEVLDCRLGHRRPWIGADHEAGVAVAPNQYIHGREFAGVISRIAAVEGNAEWIAGLPAHDHVGAGDVAVAAHGHGDKLGERVHFRCQREQRRAIHVLAAGHGETHAEEHAAELTRLHAVNEVVEGITGEARFGNLLVTHLLAFDHRAEDGNQLKVLAGPDLQKNVGGFGAFRFANIDEHHRAVLAAAGQKLAFLHDGVFREMARMALGRVSAPVHDEVSSLLHFAQRASYFATQLGGDLGGPVSERRVAIEQPPELIGQCGAFFLCFARRVAHAIDQGHVGGMQKGRRNLDRLVERCFFAIHQRHWVLLFRRVIEEPGGAEDAGVIRLVDANFIVVEVYVVADAAAESASGVFDELQCHWISHPPSWASFGSLRVPQPPQNITVYLHMGRHPNRTTRR